LTDIGFIGFSWIKGISIFNGFGLAINVVEHQSTSETKIQSLQALTRAGMLNFWLIDFTVLLVKRSGRKS